MESQAATANILTQVSCFHCGEDCPKNSIHIDDKPFCCEGCKTVYEILNENGFSDYYQIQQAPGIKMQGRKSRGAFNYLDHPEVAGKLIDFQDNRITRITFRLPQIHCASCIWLLENLGRLHPGVISSQVNFLKKEAALTFTNEKLTLKALVELLSSIGYEPEINLQSLEGKTQSKSSKQFYYQLGIAGFCFGNIMLLSFPEYLSLNRYIEPSFTRFFSYLNLVLSLPVFFYCSSHYFKSALNGLKAKVLDINVPVAVGISVLFTRSVYEILSQTGPGYLDSLAGLVFFLLIGRWFQNKTYDALSFDRNYRSYFPVAATRKVGSNEESIPLSEIRVGDVLLIRNSELIPTDSELIVGEGQIDYSFVTGESDHMNIKAGVKIFAGGRQVGGAIEVKVLKQTSQSYLTQLWNQEVFMKRDDQSFSSLINKVSKYFTPAVMLIALAVGTYWLMVDSSVAMNAFTSILIIVCPCALALATPFTLGNAMRILGRNHFYLKDTSVIESLSQTDVIVFDKTGTLTNAQNQKVRFIGELNSQESQLVKSVVYHSSHPLSRQIYASLAGAELLPVESFREVSGRGIEGRHGVDNILLGSEDFVKGMRVVKDQDDIGTRSWVVINGKVKGYFDFNNHYRENLEEVIKDLNADYNISLITGDGEGEKEFLKKYFKEGSLHFNQSPQDKLSFIQLLQNLGKKVLMVGDGLNDAGALKQSTTGISITENINNFSPSCGAIMDAKAFGQLPVFIRYSKSSIRLLFAAFGISFFYNLVGLFFAVQGSLTPVIAAILMPVSSITITFFGIASTTALALMNNLLIDDKSHLRK